MTKDQIILIILICWTCFCAFKFIETIINDIQKSKLKLVGSYRKLIQEVLYYCAPIYKANKIKYYPQYEISYYESKKRLGCYFSGKKKIVIYINSHHGSESERIKQIVHCMLHEIKHNLQHMTDPNFKNYTILSKRLTYQKNPYEIDSNAFADKHLDDCIQYLKQKGILS